jgi:hypothetical protein
MLSILFHIQPGLVLRSVCRVTCTIVYTACLTPDGAMSGSLLLPAPVCNIHPSCAGSVMSNDDDDDEIFITIFKLLAQATGRYCLHAALVQFHDS